VCADVDLESAFTGKIWIRRIYVLFCSAACENNCFRVVPELSSDSKIVLLNAREDFQGDGANEHYYILGVSKKCVLFYFVVLD